MNYEQKYKEALERAKKYVNIDEDSTQVYTKGVVEEIFPELAESEDEKIRKSLIDFVGDTSVRFFLQVYNISKEDVLAWLEKQKEPRDYRKLYKNITESKWFKKVYENKSLGIDEERKPEWNVEDKNWIDDLITAFNDEYLAGFEQMKSYGVVDWLKSLKERMGG